MRRLLSLAFPLALLVALAVATSASAQAPAPEVTVKQENMNLLASSRTTGRQNTDLAFWGNTLVQGDSRGIRVFNIANPAAPVLLSDFECNGAWGDVTIWNNLVFRSVDVPQTTSTCAGSADTAKVVTGGDHTATAQSTTAAPGFEGIRIIDISNPANPRFVGAVATDCGSHTHTIVPDPANNRVLLYVSSFPSQAISSTPTAFGNKCERMAAGSPAPPNQISGHDKLQIVQVPLSNPAGASKLTEVKLNLKGYNPQFSYLSWLLTTTPANCQTPAGSGNWSPVINGCYMGDFSNIPGYKGCHDITVMLPLKVAAAACVTEGVTLDISNPAAPVVKDHFQNPYTDLCATGVYRWNTAQGTAPTTPQCMWSSAQFTYDGKYVIFGDLTSGQTGCSSAATGTGTPSSCNVDGNTNVGVDRFYDGTSVTNECDAGAGTGTSPTVRDPIFRGAFWMFALDRPSFPVSSFKIPRYERYSNQGCTAHLLNMVPVIGHYVTPASWHLGGVDVINWTDVENPAELGFFDVDTAAAGDPTPPVVNATPTNRPAGNSAERSNAWAAYWYNGHVYASYDSPMYGDFRPEGSRGLEVFGLNAPQVAGAFRLERLNPQTQEFLIKCTATGRGSLRARRVSTLRVSVAAMGGPVAGAKVIIKGPRVGGTKTTTASGTVAFRVRPRTAGRVTIRVADLPNMLGCNAAKKVAKMPVKKKPRPGPALTGRP